MTCVLPIVCNPTPIESHISFIGIKSATIFSKWVGESDKMVTALFGLARKIAPCVIFIDEVDTVLRKRSSDSGGNNWSASVTGTFLSEWDGLTSDATAPVLVLGATNRPNDIDDAFLRRMPFVVQVSVPTLQTREQILRAMLREEPLGEDVDLQGLASLTEGATGSDLRELCRLAAISRMKCIMTETAATGVLSRVGSAAGASGLGGDKKKAIGVEAEAAGEAGSSKKRKDRPFHMGDFLMALGKMNGQAEQLQQYPKSHW
jgi:ATPase family AAA domain-containing protein 1